MTSHFELEGLEAVGVNSQRSIGQGILNGLKNLGKDLLGLAIPGGYNPAATKAAITGDAKALGTGLLLGAFPVLQFNQTIDQFIQGDNQTKAEILTEQGLPLLIGGIKGLTEKKVTGGTSSLEPKLGDLTKSEVNTIQKVVDEAGRPIEIVGSAAKGVRRGVGTNLPIGKEEGTKSDIDYITPPGSIPYFDASKLPSIDPKTGIVPGVINPFIGPGIRFEPNAKPIVIPQQK